VALRVLAARRPLHEGSLQLAASASRRRQGDSSRLLPLLTGFLFSQTGARHSGARHRSPAPRQRTGGAADARPPGRARALGPTLP